MQSDIDRAETRRGRSAMASDEERYLTECLIGAVPDTRSIQTGSSPS